MNLHHFGKSNSNPHQSEKSDPDQHESQNSGAVLDGRGRLQWWRGGSKWNRGGSVDQWSPICIFIRIRIVLKSRIRIRIKVKRLMRIRNTDTKLIISSFVPTVHFNISGR